MILTLIWLLLAWLILQERNKKDNQIVGEVLLLFPTCEGVNLWPKPMNELQMDSLIKHYSIDGVIMDISPQENENANYPDDNFRIIAEVAKKLSLPLYCIHPETLKINYGWKMLNPTTFYPKDYDYHPFIDAQQLSSYWGNKQLKHFSVMDSLQSFHGMEFIRGLRNGQLDSMYHIQLVYKTEFFKQVNRIVFKKPYSRWLIVVHRPIHGFTWYSFTQTPRYRVLK